MTYVGVDIGGTNIEMALVQSSGKILGRSRRRTPRGGKPAQVLQCLFEGIEELLQQTGVKSSSLAGIGIGVAGPVDPEKGRVVVTPNMHLSGLKIAGPVRKWFGVPTVIGNDVNAGVLGEAWLGSARGTQSAVSIFVGTGIGGGLICHGQLVTGARNTAGEIGHIVMDPSGGPRCGCGRRGCLEALASRTAIERDIRQAVAAGRKTVLTEMLDGDLRVIRSKSLRKALDRKDKLVTEVMARASQQLGYACVTVRHLVDPEVIILGGGVIEACGDFMMPIVKRILQERSMPGTSGPAKVVQSALGDDAGVLGAVALAQLMLGHRRTLELDEITYPHLSAGRTGEVSVDAELCPTDIYVRADGKVKKLKKVTSNRRKSVVRQVGLEELKKVCKGSPQTLIVGIGVGKSAPPDGLTKEGQAYLRKHDIALKVLPIPRAVREYNRTKGPKAALMHFAGAP